MPTVTFTTPTRDTTPDFRKEPNAMHSIDLRLAEALERQSLLRAARDADRRADRSARSLRLRLGAVLISAGRRLAGDAPTTPAWQG
jgi:hypothetical protein